MAGSTEEYDSLHDNVPSNIIRVPVDIESISLATDQFEDCYTNDDSVTISVLGPDTSIDEYFNDISLIPAEEKTRSILAASFGVVKDFSIDKEPYKSLNKNLLPTNKILKRELMRRIPNTKSLRGKKTAVLIILLNSDTFQIKNEK